jgi:hypothetical protein
LTATTTLGGKAGRPATPGLFVEPREAPETEPLAPLADDLARRVEAVRNGVIVEPRGREKDDLGAEDIPIR